MKNGLILILISGFFLTGYSQTKIHGTVCDADGNQLPGANIYIEGTYEGTTSNAAGQFEFTSLETGLHLLKVDFIGYKPFDQSMELVQKTIHVQVVLHETFNELQAVTIVAGTFEAGDRKKSIAITALDMVTTPSASGDLYGAVQSLPGSTTVGESGKLYVRGGDSRESKTFIDGTLVYVPYSSSAPNTTVRGRFSPFMFSGTIFSTGGYSAEFGQALSGILSLRTDEMPSEDQINISLLTVGAELGVTQTTDKAALTASVSYNNLKPYMQIVPQNTNWSNEPESYGGEMTLRFKTSKSGLIKFYTNISESNLATIQPGFGDSNSQLNYSLKNQNIFINSSYATPLSNNWIIGGGFSFTRNADFNTIDTLNYNEFLNGSHLKIFATKKFTDKIGLRIGSDVFSKIYSTETVLSGNSSELEFKSILAAFYAETDIYLSNKFVTRLGTRFEYSHYLNQFSAAPRISVAYKLSDYTQVSMAYGLFFQDPDDNSLLFTNTLNFERASHYTLNYQFEKNRRVLRSELFLKEYKNLVKFTDAPFYTPEAYTNDGYGNVWGFDLFYRDNKTIKHGEAWISYSYIDAQKNYRNYPQISTPEFTSNHNLTLVYKQWIGALRSQLGVSYKYGSPRVFNNPNSNAFNAEHTIAYQTLDLNWSFLFRQHIIFYASVSNVPGFKQHFGYNYATKPNQQGVYESNPILPTAKRFFLIGCFITLSPKGDINQLDKIN